MTQKSIPSSQILRDKTNSEFECNCKVLQEEFTKRGYESSYDSIVTKIKKSKFLDRKDTLTPKAIQKAQVLPLAVTYNHTLPNIKTNNSK